MPYSPFHPDRVETRRRRFRLIPVRTLVPNLITLLALCAGLTAIRLAIEGKLEWAVAAIVFAALLDGIDGRVARMLKGTSRFGAELDSLADFVNFGVAPALILYFWGLHELGNAGWIAAMVFAICAGLRLARFNVMIDDPNRPAWAGNFFIGMPAPAGAITVLLPIYVYFLGMPRVAFVAPVTLVYTLAIAFLMVSRLPVFSGKRVGKRVAPEMVLPVFVAVVLFFALLVSYPWVVLTIGTVLYLGSLPLGLALLPQARAQGRGCRERGAREPGPPAAAGRVAVAFTRSSRSAARPARPPQLSRGRRRPRDPEFPGRPPARRLSFRQVRFAERVERLIIQASARRYSIPILKVANRFLRLRSDNSVNRAGIKTLVLERLLHAPNVGRLERRCCRHVQLGYKLRRRPLELDVLDWLRRLGCCRKSGRRDESNSDHGCNDGRVHRNLLPAEMEIVRVLRARAVCVAARGCIQLASKSSCVPLPPAARWAARPEMVGNSHASEGESGRPSSSSRWPERSTACSESRP